MPRMRSTAIALSVLATLAGGVAWRTWGEHGRGAAPSKPHAAETVAPGGPSLHGVPREGTKPDPGAGAPAAPDADEQADNGSKPFAVPASVAIDVVGWRDRPIAGAVLTLEGLTSPQHPDGHRESLITDAAGRARFVGVRTAEFSVRIEAPGYATHEGWLSELEPGEERHRRVALVPEGTVRGRVVRAVDGAPLADAQVILRDQPPEDLYRSEPTYKYFSSRDPVTTDALGRFEIEGVLVGTEYALWAVAVGFARGERGVVLLSPDSRPDLELALEAAGTLRFRVVDSSDQPVEDYRVTLVPEDVAARLDVEREQAKRAAVRDAESEARDPLEEALAELRLYPGSRFPSDPEPLYSAWTSADGVATIHGLARTRSFRVEPSPGNHTYGPRPWVAQWGDPPLVVQASEAHPGADVVLRLAAGARLRVRCTSRSGKPCEGAPSVSWRGAPIQMGSGTENGTPFGPLSPGEGALEVALDGHAPSRTTRVLPPGEETVLDVVLDELPPLRGRVVDESGRPYERGHVQVHGASWNGTSIGSDGRFELPGVVPGLHAVSVHCPDAIEPLHADVLVEGAELTITVPKGAGGTMRAALPAQSLEVQDDDRRVFLRLHAPPPEGRWWPASQFDSGLHAEVDAGRYEWIVPAGAYTLTAVTQGCEVLRRPIQVSAGVVLDLGEISPEVTAPAEGLVELADGTPAAHARVRLEGYDMVQADGRGRFSLAHGPREALRAVVGGDRYVAVEQQVQPPAPGGLMRLKASRGASLVGRIEGVSPEEAVLAVDALAEGARPPRVAPRVDSAGQFELQLAPGRYRVSVARAGDILDKQDVTFVEGETVSVTLRQQR